jgi:hypothetical protein
VAFGRQILGNFSLAVVPTQRAENDMFIPKPQYTRLISAPCSTGLTSKPNLENCN